MGAGRRFAPPYRCLTVVTEGLSLRSERRNSCIPTSARRWPKPGRTNCSLRQSGIVSSARREPVGRPGSFDGMADGPAVSLRLVDELAWHQVGWGTFDNWWHVHTGRGELDFLAVSDQHLLQTSLLLAAVNPGPGRADGIGEVQVMGWRCLLVRS